MSKCMRETMTGCLSVLALSGSDWSMLHPPVASCPWQRFLELLSLSKSNTFNQFPVSWHKALKWFGRANANTAHLLPAAVQDTLNHTSIATGLVSGLQPSLEIRLQITQTCSVFAPPQAQQ